jgi:hypothetical protein
VGKKRPRGRSDFNMFLESKVGFSGKKSESKTISSLVIVMEEQSV